MEDKKEPIRLQLRRGITAQVDWQFNQPKPHWRFGYIDDDCDESEEDGCYQPCLLGGQDPMETIFKGIVRYDLPLPEDIEERQRFGRWLSTYDGKQMAPQFTIGEPIDYM